MKRLPLLLALLSVACGFLRAQNFDLVSGRVPVTSLDGLWRFHTGDNPAWADPSFDDSSWALLRSDKGWSDQGFKGLSGMAWYRFQVTVPENLDQISLYLPHIYTCFEVYADGKLIGTYGKMPPHAARYVGGGDYLTYALPSGKHLGRKIGVALRVWHWPGWTTYQSGGPQSGGGLVGDAKDIERRSALDRLDLLWSKASMQIVALLETLAGLAALGLFLMQRREPEYLWFSLMVLFDAATNWLYVSRFMQTWNADFNNLFRDATTIGIFLATIAFYRKLMRPKNANFMRLVVASVALEWLVVTVSDVFGNPAGIWFPSLAYTLCRLVLNAWIISVAVTGAARKSPEARLLLAPVLLKTSFDLLEDLNHTTYSLGWQESFIDQIPITSWPFPIDFSDVVTVLFLLSVFAILTLRFSRTRAHEERYASEFESARNVQEYLIPAHLPRIPGLAIESVYRPAREVGGDFFQVLPNLADGSALIVVGDVAGKGLQAGMLATLIVGAVRTAASFTTDPGRILGLLNERLLGRGLVTCLALRIERDGNATLVSAGHLPPYLNEKELPMEGAFPLGAVAGIDFPVMRFQLAEGDSLMLMSDGVAEAQDAKGHLFGFHRIAEMMRARATATTLADAAQDFGQEDDITVLTVARMAAAV